MQKTGSKLRGTGKYQCVAINASVTALQRCAMRNMAITIAVDFLVTSPQ